MSTTTSDGYTLVGITPPPTADYEISRLVNFLESLRGVGTFALEIAVVENRPVLMVRSEFGDNVRRIIADQLGDWNLHIISPTDDHMRVPAGHMITTRTLQFEGPAHVPIRTLDDVAIAKGGTDMLAGVIRTLLARDSHDARLVSQLLLRPAPLDWLHDHHRSGLSGAGGENQRQMDTERHSGASGSLGERAVEVLKWAVLVAGGFFVLQQTGSGDPSDMDNLMLAPSKWWAALGTTDRALTILGFLGASGLAAWGAASLRKRIKTPRKPVYYDPAAVVQRLNWGGFTAQLRIHAILPDGPGSLGRADTLLDTLSAAYGMYSAPMGSRVVETGRSTNRSSSGDLLSLTADHAPGPLSKITSSLFGKAPMTTTAIGTLEAASLWHPLHPGGDGQRTMGRMPFRTLFPDSGVVNNGPAFGVTTGGSRRLARFTPDAMRSHLLCIGGTRNGKSNLMAHYIGAVMSLMAKGGQERALVVVDPHSNLVDAVLNSVPRQLRDRIWLIDLANPKRLPSLNLLDTTVFTGRDVTCDGIIRIIKGVWDSWGGRLQTVMEFAIKTLYEANSQMADPEGQYTLLDAEAMLSDERFRAKVLQHVSDPELHKWWKKTFSNWSRDYSTEAITPLVMRLAAFAASEKARLIFGHPTSTINVARAIENRDIILVKTAAGTVGDDVASLVGGTILNLVNSIVRRADALPPEQRTPVSIVVDEAQMIRGVAYDSMFAEIAKFGGNVFLGTQSLAKLDELGPNMSRTLMPNIGFLAVFNTEANDATELTRQLGPSFVSSRDITFLPEYNTFIMMRDGGRRLPPFTAAILPPDVGDPMMADLIRKDAILYTLDTDASARAVNSRIGQGIQGALSKFTNPPLAPNP